ncbi:hypothetical protein ABT186_01790 [Streptomyces sp. NPDC001634]|uniref:hypothetical protein n=1 Tax=Streptomyces sp. NPDC001634 TaxID=3154390 RepID=UPI003334707B
MTDQPIRKGLLPTTPPREWEFHTVYGARKEGEGCALFPGDTGPVVVRRRVTYGDWEPVRPDHWADEPPTDCSAATPAPADDPLRQRIAAEVESEVYAYRERTMWWEETGGVTQEIARLATRGALAVVQAELDRLAALLDAESRTLAEVDERCDRYAAALVRADKNTAELRGELDRAEAERDRLARLARDRADRIDDINFARASLRTRLAEQEEETMRQHERAKEAEAAIARVRKLLTDDPSGIFSDDEIRAALQPPAPAHDAAPLACEDCLTGAHTPNAHRRQPGASSD